jgi:hypothetical protein
MQRLENQTEVGEHPDKREDLQNVVEYAEVRDVAAGTPFGELGQLEGVHAHFQEVLHDRYEGGCRERHSEEHDLALHQRLLQLLVHHRL